MGRLYISEEHTSHKNIYSIARSPQNSEFRGVKMPPRSRGRADKSRYWSNVLIWKAVLSSASVKDRRQGLVDKQCDQNTDHALDESEGHIEDQESLRNGLHCRKNYLIHTKDRFLRHEVVVEGIDDKQVGREGDQCHYCCTDKGSCNC